MTAHSPWDFNVIAEIRARIAALSEDDAGREQAHALCKARPWLHLAQRDLLQYRSWLSVLSAPHLLSPLVQDPLTLAVSATVIRLDSSWKPGVLGLLDEMLDALGTPWEILSSNQQHIIELFLGKPEGTRLLNRVVAKKALGGKDTDADTAIRALVQMGVLAREGKRLGTQLLRGSVRRIPNDVMKKAHADWR